MNWTKRISQQRKFFVLVALALVSVGVMKVLKGRPDSAKVLLGLGGLFLILEFLFPVIAQKVFALWMRFAFLLGVVNSYILISLVYFLMIFPIGTALRFFGKASPYSAAACRKRNSSWFSLESTSANYSAPY